MPPRLRLQAQLGVHGGLRQVFLLLLCNPVRADKIPRLPRCTPLATWFRVCLMVPPTLLALTRSAKFAAKDSNQLPPPPNPRPPGRTSLLPCQAQHETHLHTHPSIHLSIQFLALILWARQQQPTNEPNPTQPNIHTNRTIVFAANPRDGFVPLHSASVRTPPDADGGGGGGAGGGSSSTGGRTAAASAEMAEMLMSKVDERTNRVVRMTLDAPRSRQPQGAIDSVIGRAGHMCFIDSAPVAWLLSLALLPFLEESVERSSSK